MRTKRLSSGQRRKRVAGVRPELLVRAVLAAYALAVGSERLFGEPAPLRARSMPNAAGGSLSAWDFGVTDATFKAQRKEIWCLDGHSDAVPAISIFKVSDLSAPPGSLRLKLPSGLEQARALGLAEIPHGTLKGQNFLLVDNSFLARAGGAGVPQDAYFLVFDDSGTFQPGGGPYQPVGLPADAILSTIAVNPEREEIAAYDIQTHSVYLLDFGFAFTGQVVQLLGSKTWFEETWGIGDSVYSSGVGIAYADPDTLIATSSFYNIFQARFALAYDLLAGGVYSGSAIDLSAAAAQDLDLCFVSIATGSIEGDAVLAAVNFADDALYLYNLALSPQPRPAEITACGLTALEGPYVLMWELPDGTEPNSIRIFENGAQVASLPPSARSYQSQLPLLGKAFVEIALEEDGAVSDLRAICQLENSVTPDLDGIEYTATQISDRNRILGLAATKLPARPEDFRLYVLGNDSNRVTVLDYRLEPLPTLELTPYVASPNPNTNLAARGVAIAKIADREHLAILDSDGPGGSGPPSAAFYALDTDPPGQLALQVGSIDLNPIGSAPYLFDWDADLEGNFVAGGVEAGEFVLVRIIFDGVSLVATEKVPIPHRLLTPYTDRRLTGIGVTVLPNGSILVAGSDTFSRTYTEALLLTAWGDEPAKSARLVGYAQGLIVPNQFQMLAIPIGPGIGPRFVFGLEAAYFASQTQGEPGVGVSYISTPDIVLIRNATQYLSIPGNLVIHSTTRCAYPDMRSDQLLEEVALVPPGGAYRSGSLRPDFGKGEEGTDFYLYVINQSTVSPASLEIQMLLDDAIIGEGAVQTVLPAGRYYRAALQNRSAASFEVTLRNVGTEEAALKIVVGATGIAKATEIQFRRGDIDSDGRGTISDAISGLNWLFLGGEEPSCVDAADIDDSGKVNLSDMIALLMHLFQGGAPPAQPGLEACGPDPSEDALGDCVYKPGCP